MFVQKIAFMWTLHWWKSQKPIDAQNLAYISSASLMFLTSLRAKTRGNEEHSDFDPFIFCGVSCLLYSHIKHQSLYYREAAKLQKQAVISFSSTWCGKPEYLFNILGSFGSVG